jgi:sulfoxide reductase heme-binding subunit YedZ
MLDQLTHGPLLWFANRSTGVVLIGLLTMSTAMGVVSTARAGSVRWPRFATQALHRNVSLLTTAMLLVHIATSVIDTYVDIRWYDAVIPFLGSYSRLWLGVGAVASDLLIAVVVTSLIRSRLNHRRWRSVHLLSYLGWALGVAHGLGIGTDAGTGWGMAISALSVGVVAGFGVLRAATLVHERRIAA